MAASGRPAYDVSMLRAALVIAYAAWMGVWFWAFSFAFSNGYFRYHLPSRLTFLVLSLAAVAVPPVSAFQVVKRYAAGRLSALKTCVIHLLVSVAPLLLFWGVYSVSVTLANMFGRLAFEADDAMGFGRH